MAEDFKHPVHPRVRRYGPPVMAFGQVIGGLDAILKARDAGAEQIDFIVWSEEDYGSSLDIETLLNNYDHYLKKTLDSLPYNGETQR